MRPDAIVCTGRTDYPNQVNNVLCFPFIFRGALDVGATAINREMELACVTALAELARAGITDEVARAYGEQQLKFGRDYLLPRPFDPRLLDAIAPAVAGAAMGQRHRGAPARESRRLTEHGFPVSFTGPAS